MAIRHLLSSGTLLLFTVALSACDGSDKADTNPTTGDSDSTTGTDTGTPSWLDGDDDGVTAADGDCDDDDPTVFPGATEDCNGKDDNCNGVTDEGFGDVDADGTADCEDHEDCDGIDNDGDGKADEDFADLDSDGVADCVGDEICDGIDNDGDGLIDEGYDADGDGYTQCGTASGGGVSEALEDCDDTDASINPGATEASGDRVDNNCDGAIDDGLWSEGELVITEIMNNPSAVSDTYGEWFEVQNQSDRDLLLNGLTILSSSGSEEHLVKPADGEFIELAPGEYFVFGINGTARDNGGVDVGYVYDDITLSNESDTLSIMQGTHLVDAVSWDGGTSYPDPEGASLTLDPGFIDDELNDNAVYWCAATLVWRGSTDMGSPGGENELCTTYDHDGDGYSVATDDCDDWDDTIYPGAPEIDPAVDNDCDGDIEWMPIADADYDETRSTLYTCDTMYLDGSASHDQDTGGTIASYDWELTSAPAGSETTTDDIVETSDAQPTFIPDTAGTYTFTLTVNDGGTDSTPDTLVLPVTTRPTNNVPVANAGADKSYADVENCQAISYGVYYDCSTCDGYTFTLDASGSTDADRDWMTYEWEVLSGEYYTTEDMETSTPGITVSGVEPGYGETVTVTLEVQVTATDCYGTSSTDTMNITYTCTGA